MRWIPLISSFLVAVALAGCSSLHLNVKGTGESAWTTQGDSPARRNAVDADLQPPLRELWRFDAGAGFGSISPLMVDHVVFVANRKGEVHAVDLERGKRLGQTSFGETIEGTPVFDNGTIYVPVGWGRSAIFAYDVLRGARKWKVKGAPISTGLIIFDGHVIAADDHG
ncbi:MAG: PQQ-binding-like beta-propeller repeat protein, partial [Rhodothermales bacterium]